MGDMGDSVYSLGRLPGPVGLRSLGSQTNGDAFTVGSWIGVTTVVGVGVAVVTVTRFCTTIPLDTRLGRWFPGKEVSISSI